MAHHWMSGTARLRSVDRSKQRRWLRSSADDSAGKLRQESCPFPVQAPRPISELADDTCHTNDTGCPFSTRPFQRLCRLRETYDANNKPNRLRCEPSSTIRRGWVELERVYNGGSSNVVPSLRSALCRGERLTKADSRPQMGANGRTRRLQRRAQSPARICSIDCAIRPA
jgi:hypothetical protein